MSNRDSWPRIVPFAIYMAFIAIADLLARLGWSAADLRWLYLIKIGVVATALLAWRRRYTELATYRLGRGQLGLALAAGVLVLVLWLNLNAGWMTIGGSGGFDPHTDGRIDALLMLGRWCGAALVVPVMEELFWRSFLLRWIVQQDFLRADPARATLRAFVVTTVLFGFEHSLWLAGIVAGAIYSLLYMRSRNLWSPIIAHAVTNGLLGCWIISTGQWTYW